jgi:hypothetical protein
MALGRKNLLTHGFACRGLRGKARGLQEISTQIQRAK